MDCKGEGLPKFYTRSPLSMLCRVGLVADLNLRISPGKICKSEIVLNLNIGTNKNREQTVQTMDKEGDFVSFDIHEFIF
jgi:hypothetical protein